MPAWMVVFALGFSPVGIVAGRAQSYSATSSAQASAGSAAVGTVKYDGNSATQSITQGTGGTVTYTNTFNIPHLTQSTGQVTASVSESDCPTSGCVSGTLQASAYAHADLASASIGLQANGSYLAGLPGGAATATGALSDLLEFQNSGAGNTTVTDVGVSLTMDGAYALSAAAGSPFADVRLIMSVGGATISYQFGSQNNPQNSVVQNSGWISQQIIAESGTAFVFNGTFAVVGPLASLPVSLQMFLSCQSASCDYSHTASITFTLPSGVTFTSASGVFGNRAVAHIADGNGFQTSIVLTNAATTATPYSLRLNDEQGNPVSTGFQLAAGSLNGVIPPGSSTTIQTAGLGTQTLQGWAELTAPPTVGGSVIYSQNTGLRSIQEGTAGIGLAPSQDFFVPFDNTGGAVTSMALTNPGVNTAATSVTMRYSDGGFESGSLATLSGRSHTAFEIQQAFPNSALRSGVAEIVSSTPLSAEVFRFNSTGAFTAFDVVPSQQSFGTITRTLTHAADGNNFKTTVLLTNTAVTPMPYSLRFDDEQGNIPAAGFQLELGALQGTILAGQSLTIRTSGAGNQTYQGWAELTVPASIGGSVIYSQQTGLPTLQEGTSTIAASDSQDFFVPFDDANNAVTSMALTNDSSNAADINVTLRYSDGTSETVSYPTLASRSHRAFTMPAQFPNSFGKSGVAEFISDSPVSAVVFRFDPTGAFTALGVVEP